MANSSTTTIVPLFLLVVTALASVSREVNIVGIVEDSESDVYLVHGGKFDNIIRVPFKIPLWIVYYLTNLDRELINTDEPSLGRFSLIHSANSFLLAISIMLVVVMGEGTQMLILITILGMFWIILPVLEVEEYDLMMQKFGEFNQIKSNSSHTWSTSFLYLAAIFLSFIGIGSLSTPIQIIVIAVYVTVAVVFGALFQLLLQLEIEELDRE